MDDPSRNTKEVLEELLIGKTAIRRSERAAELEHERQLAAIRLRSHALIWTGTPEELTETITRWFRAGSLAATSLQDAMQKAAIHFVKPDGTPIIKPASVVPEAREPTRFIPLDDNYQIIEFDGRQYELTPTQSTIIRVLHQAHLGKRASVGVKEIQEELGTHSGKMSDWFRGKNKALYQKFVIQSPGSRNHYRLNF